MEIDNIYQKFKACSAISTDTRRLSKDCMYFALKGDNFNGNEFVNKAFEGGAKYCVVDDHSAILNANCILVDDVLTVLQKLATYHRNSINIPIIALTGSNGKTTTKELINTVLASTYNVKSTVGNLNNHIGVPLTLLSMTEDTEIGIVEMGANHQKEIKFLCDLTKPDYGYITNFGKAHLEGFGGVEGVIKGKSEMYDYLIADNKTVFVNTNDRIQVEKTKNTNRYSFGNTIAESDVSIDFIEAQPFVKCLYNGLEIQSQLIGDYNFSNIAAAIAMGNYFKVKDAAIKTAIEQYIPTNNRSQIIEKGTNKIILDAYNANPTSMRAALLNFEKQNGHKIAILGDMFELGKDATQEHQNIVDLTISLNLNEVVFIGENFYKTEKDSNNTEKYKSLSEFKKDFDLTKITHSTLLIKGSRGMALEKVLE